MFKKFFSNKAADIQKTNRTQESNIAAIRIPAPRPLSPCYIDPFVNVKGGKEENKGYIPVSLLMTAIDDDRMLNIAVAGNYGVGKSSVIKTAERDLKTSHKFIHISLAALLVAENKTTKEVVGTNKEEDAEESGNTMPENEPEKGEFVVPPGKKNTISEAIKEKQIEYSILQQILYRECPQKTPKSRIKRIHKTGCWKPLCIASYLILFISALLVCINPKWVSVCVLRGSINAVHSFHLIRWALIVLGAIAIRACFYVGKHYDLSVSRVGYKDVEMKIKRDVSIFNAYLDEIVYFFESTKYDVVVFEDLDRFENREVIFYKLRELNTILNNSGSLRRHKISFVYAVLDDLFGAIERVKFFDYIVTVIPVVSSLNSYEKLMTCVNSDMLFEKLGQYELRVLCEYLQDMRLLQNIVNEYNQFAPLLDSDVMREKVLFGLIVYKNYVPSDFALMYNRAGVVATAIDRAKSYERVIVEKKKSEIETFQTEIERIGEKAKKDIIQLRKKFLEKGKALSGYPTDRLLYKIGGSVYDSDSIAENSELFDSFRKGGASLTIGNVQVQPHSFQSIENTLGKSGLYDEMLDNIQIGSTRQKRELEKRVRSLKEEIATSSSSIQSIYSADTSALDKELKNLKHGAERNLVKYLILNGYLDQDYQYYISYYYPNSLRRVDRNFVMLASRHEGPQYEVELENVGEVIKCFSIDSFASNTSLLNTSLTKEIFAESKYKEYRNPICRCVMNSRRLDFILSCYRSNNKLPDSFFFHLLGVYDFWDEIDGQEGVDRDDLREIYLKYCPLEPGRVNGLLKSWLNDNYSFIDKRMDIFSVKRVLEGFLRKCSPVFKKLSLHNTPEEILKDILDNQRYEFSRHNVSAIVRRLGFYEKYSSAAYTSLRDEKRAEVLRNRVEANWERSFKAIFPDSSIRETPVAILEMLNHPELPLKSAQSYLSRQSRRIVRAELIHDNALEMAYRCSIVEASWRNVYYYSIEKGKGLPLNLLYDNVFQDKVRNSLSEAEEMALRSRLVFSNQIEMSTYKKLVPLFDVPFEKVGRIILPARMKVLIENDFLQFNEGTFKTVKEHYSFSSLFLSRNISTFLKNPRGYAVDNTDIVAAMRTLDSKAAKCAFTRAIIDNNFTPDEVLAGMVHPLFAAGDLKATEINFPLLLQIIARAPEGTRAPLGRRAILALPYSEENVTRLLKAMGGEYKRLTSETAKSSVTYSQDAIRIVNYLESKGFLKGYERKGEKISVAK